MKNNSRLKLYFYLTFVLFVFFSFIFVPKERARKNTKEVKIVDYVLFSQDKVKEVRTSLYYENQNLSYEEWLKKNRISAQLVPESYTFEEYLKSRNEPKYKQKIRYKPYYKIRYDIIARNIILFGSLLSGIFIVIRIKQIKI
ncbi:hypothetical protein [Phascolarctobacterium faecium]|uniref:hypothetical protein n=1 Tax=Phascolarctobacterium faecium TaxID=33025 RepID=UPI003AF06FF0